MSPVVTPRPTVAPRALRHRRSARRMSGGQLADLREAVAAAQRIGDDRGYQFWAGIHGLPLPEYCRHGSPLFLPWHRAYLYFFEKALQDQVPGVTLPWWDWTQFHDEGIPAAYDRKQTPERKANPLYSSPIQASGRRDPKETKTWRSPGSPGGLPTLPAVDRVLANRDFTTFQSQLEGIHNSVHIWTGGTMQSIETAAYDPLFWAHHCMIDRLWYLWQLDHPGVRLPPSYLNQALPPFGMTVRQTLDITALGYDYSAATAAVKGPANG